MLCQRLFPQRSAWSPTLVKSDRMVVWLSRMIVPHQPARVESAEGETRLSERLRQSLRKDVGPPPPPPQRAQKRTRSPRTPARLRGSLRCSDSFLRPSAGDWRLSPASRPRRAKASIPEFRERRACSRVEGLSEVSPCRADTNAARTYKTPGSGALFCGRGPRRYRLNAGLTTYYENSDPLYERMHPHSPLPAGEAMVQAGLHKARRFISSE